MVEKMLLVFWIKENDHPPFLGDLYINFAVGGLLEFPVYILTTLLLMFVGRRFPQAITYLIGGKALLVTLGVPSGSI